MDKKRMASLTALTVMLILILGNVAMAHAQSSSDSTGTINVTAECTISSPGLCLNDGTDNLNKTQLTVTTEYRVNFTLSDKDGMDDIQNAYVKMWKTAASTESGTDDENNHYTFWWNATHGAWACLGPSSGFYKSGEGSNSSSYTQYDFYVNFDLSKVANYSNTGPTYTGWKITINATDGTHSDTQTQCLGFGVAEYTECTGLNPAHSWSGLTAGSNDQPLSSPGTSLSFTAIANRVWNATAKSNVTAALEHTYSYTLGIGNVTQNSVDNATSSTSLSTSEVIIGKDGASPLDAKEIPASESGTACNCYLWVDIPAGQQPGAYVYKLTITVQKD